MASHKIWPALAWIVLALAALAALQPQDPTWASLPTQYRGLAAETATPTAEEMSLTLTATSTPEETLTLPAETPTVEETTTLPTETPTPTITSTPTNTPTPTPGPVHLPLVLKGTRRLLNGDFETGSFRPGWQESGDLPRDVVSVTERPGYVALLGNPNYNNAGGCPVGEAAIEQTIDIPQTGNVFLRFFYRIYSYDTLQFDYFAVYIVPWPTGQPRRAFFDGRISWNDLLWSSGWKEVIIPLNTYRGSTITIRFSNAMTNEDGWYNTWTYVDDVRLELRP